MLRLAQDVIDDTRLADPENVQEEAEQNELYFDTPDARRVGVVQLPFLQAFYQSYPIQLTLDSGATTNMVKSSTATCISLPVTPSSQIARQADGCTPLTVVGETHCSVTSGIHTFQLHALVFEKLDVDILA